VTSELQRFVACGDPAHGFAWLVCDDCEHHRLVAFSCNASSARWVDGLFPFQRVRQWVLTVPWSRRWLFARRHDLARGVLRLTLEEVRRGMPTNQCGLPDGQTGAVTVVQRFGSALNLNVHFHILAVDGVYAPESDGKPTFRTAPAPTTGDVEALIERIATRCESWLDRQGFGAEGSADHDEDDTQAVLHAAAVAGRSAFEERRSNQVLYHGVFAPRSKLRSLVVPRRPRRPDEAARPSRTPGQAPGPVGAVGGTPAPRLRRRGLPLPPLQRSSPPAPSVRTAGDDGDPGGPGPRQRGPAVAARARKAGARRPAGDLRLESAVRGRKVQYVNDLPMAASGSTRLRTRSACARPAAMRATLPARRSCFLSSSCW
jgi:hypothetical protein